MYCTFFCCQKVVPVCLLKTTLCPFRATLSTLTRERYSRAVSMQSGIHFFFVSDLKQLDRTIDIDKQSVSQTERQTFYSLKRFQFLVICNIFRDKARGKNRDSQTGKTHIQTNTRKEHVKFDGIDGCTISSLLLKEENMRDM